jgi:DNA polymerase delta subunit 2
LFDLLLIIFLGKTYPIKKISDLSEHKTTKCILIGSTFKNMVLKPSILRDIAEENQLNPLPPPQDYNSATDDVILEDSIQRIKLIGNLKIQEIVSGIVCAAVGRLKIRSF